MERANATQRGDRDAPNGDALRGCAPARSDLPVASPRPTARIETRLRVRKTCRGFRWLLLHLQPQRLIECRVPRVGKHRANDVVDVDGAIAATATTTLCATRRNKTGTQDKRRRRRRERRGKADGERRQRRCGAVSRAKRRL